MSSSSFIPLSAYLSENALLQIEEAVALDFLVEMYGENRNPKQTESCNLALMLSVMQQQTELLRLRNSAAANRPLQEFWADRSLTVAERSYCIAHLVVLSAFIANNVPAGSRSQCIKAVANIENDLEDILRIAAVLMEGMPNMHADIIEAVARIKGRDSREKVYQAALTIMDRKHWFGGKRVKIINALALAESQGNLENVLMHVNRVRQTIMADKESIEEVIEAIVSIPASEDRGIILEILFSFMREDLKIEGAAKGRLVARMIHAIAKASSSGLLENVMGKVGQIKGWIQTSDEVMTVFTMLAGITNQEDLEDIYEKVCHLKKERPEGDLTVTLEALVAYQDKDARRRAYEEALSFVQALEELDRQTLGSKPPLIWDVCPFILQIQDEENRKAICKEAFPIISRIEGRFQRWQILVAIEKCEDPEIRKKKCQEALESIEKEGYRQGFESTSRVLDILYHKSK